MKLNFTEMLKNSPNIEIIRKNLERRIEESTDEIEKETLKRKLNKLKKDRVETNPEIKEVLRILSASINLDPKQSDKIHQLLGTKRGRD